MKYFVRRVYTTNVYLRDARSELYVRERTPTSDSLLISAAECMHDTSRVDRRVIIIFKRNINYETKLNYIFRVNLKYNIFFSVVRINE